MPNSLLSEATGSPRKRISEVFGSKGARNNQVLPKPRADWCIDGKFRSHNSFTTGGAWYTEDSLKWVPYKNPRAHQSHSTSFFFSESSFFSTIALRLFEGTLPTIRFTLSQLNFRGSSSSGIDRNSRFFV